AEAAIVGTAAIRPGAVGFGDAGGLAELVPVEVGDVGTDEVFDDTVLGTAFAEPDPAGTDDDFGVDDAAACGAEAPRRPEEGVVAKVHGYSSYRVSARSSAPTAGHADDHREHNSCERQKERHDHERPRYGQHVDQDAAHRRARNVAVVADQDDQG